MARESQLRLAAQHGASCGVEAGLDCKAEELPRAGQGQGQLAESGSQCSGSVSLQRSTGSACFPPPSPSTPPAAQGDRALSGQLLQASWSCGTATAGSGSDDERSRTESMPPAVGSGAQASTAAANRVVAAAARSTQLSSAMALPRSSPEPATAQHSARSTPHSMPRRSLSTRLRGLFTCQPLPQSEGGTLGGVAESRTVRSAARAATQRTTPRLLHATSSSGLPSGDSFSFTAAAANVPATSAHLLQAWQEIRDALSQIEQASWGHRILGSFGGAGRSRHAACAAVLDSCIALYARPRRPFVA